MYLAQIVRYELHTKIGFLQTKSSYQAIYLYLMLKIHIKPDIKYVINGSRHFKSIIPKDQTDSEVCLM